MLLSRSLSLFGIAGVTMLSACSGGGLPQQPAPSGAITNPAHGALQPRGASRSWMAPDAKGKSLVYVSDSGPSKAVNVYTFGSLQPVGQLTGFTEPEGLCADKAGDVFVPDNSEQVFEYAHAATSPTRIFSDPGNVPSACAVDPKTGNLAIVNSQSLQGPPGSVLIFPGASGTPTTYTNANIMYLFYAGYDNRGNLFIGGRVLPYGAFALEELPRGGDALTQIGLDHGMNSGGAVQWDGQYLAIGDPVSNQIDRFAISGSNGTLQGTVDLGDALSVSQFWIQPYDNGKPNPKGRKVLGADSGGEYGFGELRYWNYPAGGAQVKGTNSGICCPIGVTVSKGASL